MSSVYVICCIFLQTFQTYFFAYRQTVWTQVRLLLEEQSDLGPHCLQQSIRQRTKQMTIVVFGVLMVKMSLL